MFVACEFQLKLFSRSKIGAMRIEPLICEVDLPDHLITVHWDMEGLGICGEKPRVTVVLCKCCQVVTLIMRGEPSLPSVQATFTMLTSQYSFILNTVFVFTEFFIQNLWASPKKTNIRIVITELRFLEKNWKQISINRLDKQKIVYLNQYYARVKGIN